MRTIKTALQLADELEEAIPGFEAPSALETAAATELRRLTEALNVAQTEVELHRRVVHRLQDERDALQAKLEEVTRDRDEWKEATILANQRFKTAEAKLSAIEKGEETIEQNLRDRT